MISKWGLVYFIWLMRLTFLSSFVVVEKMVWISHRKVFFCFIWLCQFRSPYRRYLKIEMVGSWCIPQPPTLANGHTFIASSNYSKWQYDIRKKAMMATVLTMTTMTTMTTKTNEQTIINKHLINFRFTVLSFLLLFFYSFSLDVISFQFM